jgi:hypothetical protein
MEKACNPDISIKVSMPRLRVIKDAKPRAQMVREYDVRARRGVDVLSSWKVGDGSSCKFHLRPLDEVIKHEREAGLVDPVPGLCLPWISCRTLA